MPEDSKCQCQWEEHFRKSKQIGNWANIEQIGETLSGKLSGCSDSRVARAQMFEFVTQLSDPSLGLPPPTSKEFVICSSMESERCS